MRRERASEIVAYVAIESLGVLVREQELHTKETAPH